MLTLQLVGLIKLGKFLFLVLQFFLYLLGAGACPTACGILTPQPGIETGPWQ